MGIQMLDVLTPGVVLPESFERREQPPSRNTCRRVKNHFKYQGVPSFCFEEPNSVLVLNELNICLIDSK